MGRDGDGRRTGPPRGRPGGWLRYAANVPCPQWHVFELVSYLEGATGVPIVTSDGGDFSYAFRELGIHDVPAGHGVLLDQLRSYEAWCAI